MCLLGFNSCWVRLSRVWVRGKAGKEKCAHSPQACTDQASIYSCVLWASLRAPVLYCVMSAVWESQAFRCLAGGGKAVATMWVKKEGVILTSVPYAHVLYRQYRGELCPHCCLVPPSASFQCGDCGEEYCSRRCLQAAAPVHELECSLLLAGGEPEDPTSWLLLRYVLYFHKW